MMTIFRNIFIVCLFVYLLLCALLFLYQRSFIYVPNKHLENFANYNLPGFQEIILNTSDNHKVVSWYKKPKDLKSPTIIYFHGNGGNLSHRIHKFISFTQSSGYGLIAIDYRGYGNSKGTPTEAGLYNDARAAMHYLQSKKIPESKMIIYGESLGTAVAIKMATEFKVRLVALEAPFTSAVDIGNEMFKLFPVSFLILDKYDSISMVKNIQSPIIIFHGKKDSVISSSHSKALYEVAKNPKKRILYDQYNHQNIDPNDIITEISKFNSSLYS